MNNPTSETLIENISTSWREIYKMEKLISQHKKSIRENEKVLFKTCNHEWEYDTACGPYERVKYQCIKCRLWKNPYMYT